MKTKIMTLAVASVMLCAGSVLAAEPAIQMNRAEASALQASKISVAQAISIAQAQSHEKVTNIVSRPGGDHDAYSITLLADGQLRMVTVDGITGVFSAQEKLGPVGSAEQQAISRAREPIGRAVQVAENYTGGKAGDAGIETMRNGRNAYEVRVLKNDGFYDVWVGMDSGKVLKTAVL